MTPRDAWHDAWHHAWHDAWDQLWAIVWKDLRCELRGRQVWMAMGLFALLALVIFNFAFDLRVDNQAAVAPGALWIAFVFASMLGLGRTVATEQEKGAMDRLLLCPVDRQIIFLAKLVGNLVFIVAVEVVAVPVFAAIYNLPVLTPRLIPIVLLGTLGIATIGTLFATITASTRAREMLLPLLVFPLIVPVVIGAVRATQALLVPVAGDAPWLGLMAAFDIIFLSISTLTFKYVAED
jgi:heme exporter protein B